MTKQRKETNVTSAFTIESIVTVYHFPLKSYEATSELAVNNEVVYDFWQLYYLEQGECGFCIDGQEIILSGGQLIFCEPGKVRRTLYMRDPVVGIVSFRCRSEYMHLLKNTALSLTGDMKKNLNKLLKMGTDIFTWVSDTEQYIGQELRQGASGHQLQTIKNRLELLLIDFLDDRLNSPINTAVSINQQNYYEQQFIIIEGFLRDNIHRNLLVTDICAHTGLSVNTIKRIYRTCMGTGVIHHFLNMKIEKAKEMIRDTEMSYTQISEYLGFSSIHYFSRLFRQLTGLSPRQYAKSLTIDS